MSQTDGSTARTTSQQQQLSNPNTSTRIIASGEASNEKNKTQRLGATMVTSTNESMSDQRIETAATNDKAVDSTPFKKSLEKKQNLCKQLE